MKKVTELFFCNTNAPEEIILRLDIAAAEWILDALPPFDEATIQLRKAVLSHKDG